MAKMKLIHSFKAQKYDLHLHTFSWEVVRVWESRQDLENQERKKKSCYCRIAWKLFRFAKEKPQNSAGSLADCGIVILRFTSTVQCCFYITVIYRVKRKTSTKWKFSLGVGSESQGTLPKNESNIEYKEDQLLKTGKVASVRIYIHNVDGLDSLCF